MPEDNPVVVCGMHTERFCKVDEEVGHDGTQTLVKQYWEATCGCKVEITLAIPDATDKPS